MSDHSHQPSPVKVQERATARALGEHMAQHRVDMLERLLGLAPKG